MWWVLVSVIGRCFLAGSNQSSIWGFEPIAAYSVPVGALMRLASNSKEAKSMFTASSHPSQQEKSPLPDIPRDVLIAGIVSDFETDCVDAITTLKRLNDNCFLASPETLAQILIAGLKSLNQGAR